MLSSAEAVVSFGPMRNPEITERLYKSRCGFRKPYLSKWRQVQLNVNSSVDISA